MIILQDFIRQNYHQKIPVVILFPSLELITTPFFKLPYFIFQKNVQNYLFPKTLPKYKFS